MIQAICGRRQLSLKVGTGSGWVLFCQNWAQRSLHINLLLDQMYAIQTGSKPVPHNRIQAFFGRTEANQILVGCGIYNPAQFWLLAGCINKTLPNQILHVYWVCPRTGFQFRYQRPHTQKMKKLIFLPIRNTKSKSKHADMHVHKHAQ